jgi:rod shape determining protein RodA
MSIAAAERPAFGLIGRAWAAFVRPIDGALLAIALAIVAVGLIVLFSAADQSLPRVRSQVASLGLSLTVMWLVANVSPQKLARIALPLYVAGVVMLVAVALFGIVVNGSRRWLDIGIGRFQPSELMKIGVPLMVAWYFGVRDSRLRSADFVVAAILIALPFWLVKRQPDLGTSLMIGASGFYVVFLAGLPWRVMAVLGALAAAAGPVLWNHLHGYQRDRILTLLDPGRDPLGAGYHSAQAGIAIGSGGVYGKGWLNGTQTHLDFLPERHTDFIFAVFGEEFGLVGNVVLLLLYCLLLGRGMVIAANASTVFARLLAGAITLMFFTYAFVNMGMVSGILPVVGVPLPMVSYGGTALLSLFAGLGILMSINAHRKLVSS